MEYVPINFGMLRHPENWLIVCLMVLIGAFLLESLSNWYVAHINPILPVAAKPATGPSPQQ
jgi:hypothetical protein